MDIAKACSKFEGPFTKELGQNGKFYWATCPNSLIKGCQSLFKIFWSKPTTRLLSEPLLAVLLARLESAYRRVTFS